MTPYDAKPWTAFYPPGTRPVLDSLPFRTIGELASAMAHPFRDKTAFTCVMPNGMYGNLTYGEVDELSDAFAVYLREVAGLKPGDRVAIQIPNTLPFPVVAFGVFKAGCVLVNVNPLYTAEEMGRVFADATPSALVIIDMFADKLPAALAMQSIPTVIVTRAAEMFPTAVRTVIGLVQKYWDRSVKPVEVAHITFAEVIAGGRARMADGSVAVASFAAGVDGSSLACLQYTGGTTGVSKGAMLTHGNLIANMAQVIELIGQDMARGEEVVLSALPMYHIFAFTANLLVFWNLGAQNIIIPNPRPLSNLRRAFENYRITWMTGVNTLFNGLLGELWFMENPPKHLKAAVAGGMALQTAVAERWEKVTGTPVIEGYGLTETSPVLCFNPFGKARPGSIGIPAPSTEIRLIDDEGRPVPPGQPGELAARGPQVMAGYWNRPDETAKVLSDGWLRTGDVATMDPDGYFRIVDRKKDVIIVSGFNVFPNEVEDCLARHPGVVESAVIGVPDGAAGEAPKAFVVRRDPTLTPEDLRAFCKQHLAAYKVPKFVEFRADLPKSNVGKILRKELRPSG